MSQPVTKTEKDDYLSIAQAAKLSNISRQAVYQAMKKKKLREYVINGSLFVKKSELKDYHLNKYSRHDSMIDGELIYDKSKGLYSVIEVSRLLSIPIQRIYYAIRMERLPCQIKGCHYVINIKDIEEYINKLEITCKILQDK